MALIFRKKNDFDNVHECHRLFFKCQKENSNTIIEEFCNWYFKVYCSEYFTYCFERDKKYSKREYETFDLISLLLNPTSQIVGEMSKVKHYLTSSVSEKLENSRKRLEEALVKGTELRFPGFSNNERAEILQYEDALKWIEENL